MTKAELKLYAYGCWTCCSVKSNESALTFYFFYICFSQKFSKNVFPTNEGAYFNQNDKIIITYRARCK